MALANEATNDTNWRESDYAKDGSSTFKIIPVFDYSARLKNKPKQNSPTKKQPDKNLYGLQIISVSHTELDYFSQISFIR